MTRSPDDARRRDRDDSNTRVMPWALAAVGALTVAAIVVAIIISRGPKEPPAGQGGGAPAPDDGKPKPKDKSSGVVPKTDGTPLFTREKVDRIQTGMKKEDVAALFGPGRAATEEEARAAHVAATQADGEARFARARTLGVRTWEKWADGGDSLFVGYGPTSRGDRVAYFIWFHAASAGGAIRPGGLFQAGDLEDAAKRWDEERAILTDPKWKAGAEARAALLGRWLVKSGGGGYEFFADGTHKWLGSGPYTSTYRFTDPQTLELDGYDPFAKTKLPAIKYRVLVAGDEMYLVHGPDTTRPLPVGPYIRQPAEKK